MTDPRSSRQAGARWLIVAGAGLVLFGVLLLVGPGPGWLVVSAGLVTMGAGLVLRAVG